MSTALQASWQIQRVEGGVRTIVTAWWWSHTDLLLQFQVVLYLLLMEERHGVPVDRGLLQYLQKECPEVGLAHISTAPEPPELLPLLAQQTYKPCHCLVPCKYGFTTVHPGIFHEFGMFSPGYDCSAACELCRYRETPLLM